MRSRTDERSVTLAILAAGVCAIAGACRDTEARDQSGATSTQGGMAVTDSWTLSMEPDRLASLFASSGSLAWLLTGGGTLIRMEPGRPPSEVTPILPHPGGEVVSASAASGTRVWLIWRDAVGMRHAGLWDPSRPDPVAVVALADPRLVRGPDREGVTWCLATDTGLYRWVAGRGERVDDARYNALILSDDGARLLARRIPTDDVVLSRVGTLDWQVVRASFDGDLVGLAPDGAVVLLEMSVWRKGEPPPENRVVSISSSGIERELARGPFLQASVAGGRLVTVRPGPPGTLIVESRDL